MSEYEQGLIITFKAEIQKTVVEPQLLLHGEATDWLHQIRAELKRLYTGRKETTYLPKTPTVKRKRQLKQNIDPSMTRVTRNTIKRKLVSDVGDSDESIATGIHGRTFSDTKIVKITDKEKCSSYLEQFTSSEVSNDCEMGNISDETNSSTAEISVCDQRKSTRNENEFPMTGEMDGDETNSLDVKRPMRITSSQKSVYLTPTSSLCQESDDNFVTPTPHNTTKNSLSSSTCSPYNIPGFNKFNVKEKTRAFEAIGRQTPTQTPTGTKKTTTRTPATLRKCSDGMEETPIESPATVKAVTRSFLKDVNATPIKTGNRRPLPAKKLSSSQVKRLSTHTSRNRSSRSNAHTERQTKALSTVKSTVPRAKSKVKLKMKKHNHMVASDETPNIEKEGNDTCITVEYEMAVSVLNSESSFIEPARHSLSLSSNGETDTGKLQEPGRISVTHGASCTSKGVQNSKSNSDKTETCLTDTHISVTDDSTDSANVNTRSSSSGNGSIVKGDMLTSDSNNSCHCDVMLTGRRSEDHSQALVMEDAGQEIVVNSFCYDMKSVNGGTPLDTCNSSVQDVNRTEDVVFKNGSLQEKNYFRRTQSQCEEEVYDDSEMLIVETKEEGDPNLITDCIIGNNTKDADDRKIGHSGYVSIAASAHASSVSAVSLSDAADVAPSTTITTPVVDEERRVTRSLWNTQDVDKFVSPDSCVVTLPRVNLKRPSVFSDESNSKRQCRQSVKKDLEIVLHTQITQPSSDGDDVNCTIDRHEINVTTHYRLEISEIVYRTPSPKCPSEKIVHTQPRSLLDKKSSLSGPFSLLKSRINSVSKVYYTTGSGFRSHNTSVKKPSFKEQEEAKRKELMTKEMQTRERLRKRDENLRKLAEDRKKKRQEHMRQVSRARLESEQKKEQNMKLRVVKKVDETTQGEIRHLKLKEELERQKYRLKKQTELDERKRMEEEDRVALAKLQEEEQRRVEQNLQKKRKLEEAKKQKIAEERQKKLDLLSEKERQAKEQLRQRQLEEAELEKLLLKKQQEKEREAARQKAERDRAELEKRKERERKLAQEIKELNEKEKKRLLKEAETSRELKEAEERTKKIITQHNTKLEKAAGKTEQIGKTGGFASSSTDSGKVPNSPQSYAITPVRPVVTTLDNSVDYNINDLCSDDDTDNEDEPNKPIPAWAERKRLQAVIINQLCKPSNASCLFGAINDLDLNKIFVKKRPKFNKRTSSAIWDIPPLIAAGKYNYL